MKRSRLLSVLALVFALGALSPVSAQQVPTAGLGANADEEAAFKEYKENHLISARTRAEKGLAANPNGIVGNYVMGLVMRESEGDLAKAMLFMGRSRELYEKKFGHQPGSAAPWQFHRELLYSLQALAGEMDEYEYQIELLKYHNALYDPDFIAEEAWALLKLRRFDDARKRAKDALASSDPWQKSFAKNALCAIEVEAQERERAYKACTESLLDARMRDKASKPEEPTSGLTVNAYNASLAALGVFKFTEAEDLLREVSARREFTIANPWRVLAGVYLSSGRGMDAASALRDMQAWRQRNPASLRDQDRAETEATVATFLLAAGEAESGLRLIQRAIEMPDRHGLVSDRPEQHLGANSLVARALLNMHIERLSERASVHGTVGGYEKKLDAFGQSISELIEGERVKSVLVDSDILISTFRIYLAGGLQPVPLWLIGDLIDVVGTGVAAESIARARAKETMKEVTPYYDALEAEVAFRSGDRAEGLALYEKVKKTLPKQEVLLLARLTALAAEASVKGDAAKARALFIEALEKDAGAVRRLGLRIPVKVTAAGGDAALERARTLLERSPRLRLTSDDPFTIELTRTGDKLKICLSAPLKPNLSCTDIERIANVESDKKKPARPEADTDFAARGVDEFHRVTFAPKFGLGAEDLRLLDGSQSLAKRAQNDDLKKATQ